MAKIEDFRRLCQSWLDALTEDEANEIADKIDSIANTNCASWLSLLRQIEQSPKLPIEFVRKSHGRNLDRTCHPEFSSKEHSTEEDEIKEKIIA